MRIRMGLLLKWRMVYGVLAAQGGEDGEHQRVHTENPHNFQRVAPCRAAGEQAQRAEHNADNGKLIGAALAQLGMGVVDQPARKNIRKSVDDFTYHQRLRSDRP